MKKGLVVILIMLASSLIKLAAQNTNLDKLNAYKIAFFTRRLNLTPGEAEKFWPVYNEFQRERNIAQIEKMSIIKNFNQNERAMTDLQLTSLGDRLIATISQESALAVSFHKNLKEILPPAKVIRFYQVEGQYKTQLLNELQGANQQQRSLPNRDF